jgi:hypothetical protein
MGVLRLVFLFAAVCAVVLCACVASATPLDDYVNKPDDNYAWTDLNQQIQGKGWTGHLLNMTSQAWLTPADSSQPIWWHIMVIIVPDEVKVAHKGMLYITGGNNRHGGNPLPDETSEDVWSTAYFAKEAGMICACLFQVPNEPITFPSDPLLKVSECLCVHVCVCVECITIRCTFLYTHLHMAHLVAHRGRHHCLHMEALCAGGPGLPGVAPSSAHDQGSRACNGHGLCVD